MLPPFKDLRSRELGVSCSLTHTHASRLSLCSSRSASFVLAHRAQELHVLFEQMAVESWILIAMVTDRGVRLEARQGAFSPSGVEHPRRRRIRVINIKLKVGTRLRPRYLRTA